MRTNLDQAIIAKIVGGDTNAFTELVDRYKDMVYTLALRMLKNREDAEEVSQDTFIKVFKAIHKFKGRSKLSTWIYRVAYNTCLDSLKKIKLTQNNVAIDSYTEYQIKMIDDALDEIEEQEQKQVIQDCIQMLTSTDSVLLTLFYFEELSLIEISKVINIKPNNVKVKLYRARKNLAKVLELKLEPEIIEYYAKQ